MNIISSQIRAHARTEIVLDPVGNLVESARDDGDLVSHRLKRPNEVLC
eukprot:SAG31_NODE_41575_length_275_cov_0.880682_2_plen_47_part_01